MGINIGDNNKIEKSIINNSELPKESESAKKYLFKNVSKDLLVKIFWAITVALGLFVSQKYGLKWIENIFTS